MNNSVPFESERTKPSIREEVQAWVNIAGLKACNEWLKLVFSGMGDRWTFYLYLNGYNDGLCDLAPWEQWQCFCLCTARQHQTHEKFVQWLKKTGIGMEGDLVVVRDVELIRGDRNA